MGDSVDDGGHGVSPEELDRARRFYAEEIRSVAPIEREEVVEAFARVPRERFLGAPPWKIVTPMRGYRETPDGDPRHTYHNVLVAIDPKRSLNNGQPSFVGMLIDRSGASEGHHVVHVGCGSGYYSAILAEIVGESGHVTAIEVDEELALRARANLAHLPQVEVVHADGADFDPGAANAILVNAGATHPSPLWLDRLLPGATLILPLTVGGELHGVGSVLEVVRESRGFSARFISPVGIFHCSGARDEGAGRLLEEAFGRGPEAQAKVRSLRTQAHEESGSCWLHGAGFCLSTLAVS